MENKAKIGDKFQLQRTTPYGKIINETITIIAIVGTRVLFDTGFEYPLAHFNQIINK